MPALFCSPDLAVPGYHKGFVLRKILLIIGIVLVSGILCFIYAHFEYTNVKITEINIDSPKLKGSAVRIMFITDFQFDTAKKLNEKALRKLVDKANRQEADLILLGGDFVNWGRRRDGFYAIFRNLNIPPLGAYAVLGNHDYYDVAQNIGFLESMGIQVLRNRNTRVAIKGGYIQLAGVEDYWSGRPDFDKAIRGSDREHFLFLLAHNPDYFADMLRAEQRALADLTLSGHTHAGQVTFMGLLIGKPVLNRKNAFRYRYGLQELDGSPIYISSGTGGNALGFFIRFLARPEIVMINLKGN